MLFGSYFGDWDVQNNFLRAPLASKTHALTNFWAGRPHWHVHHMALGETIGYGARLSQNNGTLYTAGFSARRVHVALMGDPSLRMHILTPPSNFQTALVNDSSVISLSWKAATDTVIGYYVYRMADSSGAYELMDSNWVCDTSYYDSVPSVGPNYYLVRAVELRISSSGSYYNLSQGMFAQQYVDSQRIATDTLGDLTYCLGEQLEVNYSLHGPSFTEGNFFKVELSDSTGSFNSATVLGSIESIEQQPITITIPTSTIPADGYRFRVYSTNPVIVGKDNGQDVRISLCTSINMIAEVALKVYPNPTAGSVNIYYPGSSTINLYNLMGQLLMSIPMHDQIVVDLAACGKGIYMIELLSSDELLHHRIVLQ